MPSITFKFTQGILNNWLIKQRWWILGFIAAGLFLLEFYEDSFKPLNSIHFIEYLLYVFFLIIIGLLFSFLLQVSKDQVRNLKILDYKNKIDLEIITQTDWRVLTHQLVKYPGQIARVEAASLFVLNPLTSEFEFVAESIEQGNPDTVFFLKEMCPVCLAALNENKRTLIRCPSTTDMDCSPADAETYCLAIRDFEQIHAIIYFRLFPRETLSVEQADLLQTIEEDLLVALKAGQDRKMLVEMRETEASLSERRKVFHFLHDSLGQNLSFINLKVSQLIAEINQLDPETMQDDLERVRETAGLSYNIVRGILEVNQASTLPSLSNLLIEYGTKVSQRANLELIFDTKGEPIPVGTEVQRTVFYVFQEALNNIEKHARANKVKVGLCWNIDDLEISIQDDGQGFHPEKVDASRNFGLSIMQERVSKVNGMIELITAENAGTLVKFCVPIPEKT